MDGSESPFDALADLVALGGADVNREVLAGYELAGYGLATNSVVAQAYFDLAQYVAQFRTLPTGALGENYLRDGQTTS